MVSHRTNKRKLYVGLSGGVDSSVSLALLQKEGYDVVGVFIKTWQPDFIECTWRDERRDAMRVCAQLDIPFITLDLEEEYKRGVADYMIAEYRKGRTPNPDVLCNREVKFGGFLRWALAHGADFVATGHYAMVKKNKSGLFELHQGKDESKDQAYFLWMLTQNELAHILFPVGAMQKSRVRKHAEHFALPTATKKDSQGVCFLGPLDMKDFLKHYIAEAKGDVRNENGEIIGTHNGVLFFTLGERHGFTITKKSPHEAPYYVVDKNLDANTITVTQKEPKKSLFAKKEYVLEQTNWITEYPQLKTKYKAQIRYRGEYLDCVIKKIVANTATITFSSPEVISPGQSVVIYYGSQCVGGGIVA